MIYPWFLIMYISYWQKYVDLPYFLNYIVSWYTVNHFFKLSSLGVIILTLSEHVGRFAVVLSVSLSVCLSICLSDYLSVSLSVCLTVCLSVSLSVCMYVCLSLCLSVCLSVCLFICRSVCLSICWFTLWFWRLLTDSKWQFKLQTSNSSAYRWSSKAGLRETSTCPHCDFSILKDAQDI